jgi:hypothetical protein
LGATATFATGATAFAFPSSFAFSFAIEDYFELVIVHLFSYMENGTTSHALLASFPFAFSFQAFPEKSANFANWFSHEMSESSLVFGVGKEKMLSLVFFRHRVETLDIFIVIFDVSTV